MQSFEGSLERLTKYLKLAPYALVIKKINSTSTNDSQHETEISYVFRHFSRQKNIAKVIIGVGIIIALLGVAIPLGFQTFTDKILPYSAQGSLIVVVALLLLATIATSVFQCFHDYQESVLFAKYQNGLGKEVFSRLLDMNIPFFDGQKVGDLTKLIDQIEEASNFLVRQFLNP